MFADVDIVDESAPPPTSFTYDGLAERFTPVCTPSRNRKDLLGKLTLPSKPSPTVNYNCVFVDCEEGEWDSEWDEDEMATNKSENMPMYV